MTYHLILVKFPESNYIKAIYHPSLGMERSGNDNKNLM